MNLKVVPFFRPVARPRDWNHQELAEFYRVEASMIRSGLSVLTDRGLSDEGDPWFAFCRTDTEEVIVHFARIDGCYVVASPAFESCVRGQDFRSLIERLIESHPLVVPKPQKGRNIFIHPAALLVALVTTCFFKLGQTEAVAADIKGSKLTVADASEHKEALKGANPVFLNEQAANTVLAILAAASSWTMTDLFSNGANDAPHISASEAQTQTVVADASGFVFSPLETEANARTSHALNKSEPNDGIISQASDYAFPVSSERLPVHSSSTAASTSQTVLPEKEAASPFVSHEAHAKGSFPILEGGGPMTPVAQVEQTSTSALSFDVTSFANQEVSSILGDTIRTHLLEGQPTAEQSQVIAAEKSEVIAASSIETESIHVASPSISQVSKIDDKKYISTETGVASGASDFVQGNIAAPESVPETRPHIATSADVDQAIYKFVAMHPDFLLFTVKKEIILFDSHLTAGNMSSAVHQEFSYSDGSMIFLIGLPASASSDVSVSY